MYWLVGLLLASGVSAGADQIEARVTSVYDGDTFTLENGDKVRLKLVNTPEMRPYEEYATEAKYAVESWVRGRTVTLSVTPGNERDGYGRLIARAATAEGDLSKHLVEQGLAHVFVIPPERDDITELIDAQRIAKENRRGIWRTSRYRGSLHITSFHANAPGDDRENLNGEYLRIANIDTVDVNLEGYRIENAHGDRFVFPAITVPAGHTFKLYTGRGGHQANPEYQLAVYLGSRRPIWNNNLDRAVLKDPDGRVIDSREHAPKSRRR